MYSALVGTVGLMRLPLCYWATHRLLVIQVNHYCFIATHLREPQFKFVQDCRAQVYLGLCEGKREGALLSSLVRADK